jgi:hypothetical protein
MKISLFFWVLHLTLEPMLAYADSPPQGLNGKVGVNFATWARKGDMPSVADRTYTHGVTGGISLHLLHWKPVSPQLELLFTPRGTGWRLVGSTRASSISII